MAIVRPSTDTSDQVPSESKSNTPTSLSSPDVFILPVRETQTATSTFLRRPPSNSRYPMPSSSATRTVGYVKPSFSALPSRLPRPTKHVILSPIPVTQRPSQSPAIKPPVVNSQLVINNGNVTYLSDSKTLQYIQASLACAAGVPLENIRILNITQRANGTQAVVLYDRAAPGLTSDGSAACYRPVIATTSPNALARRMQTVDETSIAVDYAIIDPPVSLLEPTVFAATITGDVGIASIVAESGASGVDVVVPQEVIDYAAAPMLINTDVQLAADKTPMYIGIAMGAGGICALIAAIVLTKKKKQGAAKALTSRIDVTAVNPTVRTMVISERRVFVPGYVRG
jgi:hypothetical protein